MPLKLCSPYLPLSHLFQQQTRSTSVEQQEVNPSLLDSNDLTMSICDDAIDRHTTMNSDDSLSSYN